MRRGGRHRLSPRRAIRGFQAETEGLLRPGSASRLARASLLAPLLTAPSSAFSTRMIPVIHRTTPFLAALVLAACSSGRAPSAAPSTVAPALAITNVTVVDVTGGPSRPGQTVVVSGNR